MSLRTLALSCTLVAALFAARSASATTIDFEDGTPFTPVGSTYSSLGVTFDSNFYFATQVDPNYPPNSGSQYIYTYGTDSSITFTNPVDGVSIWYTAAPDGVTIDAFDASGTQIEEEFGASEYGGTAEIVLNSADIASIVIHSTPTNATFDDLSFNINNVSSTPEPSSLILLGTGAFGMMGAARRRFVQR